MFKMKKNENVIQETLQRQDQISNTGLPDLLLTMVQC